jgi:hypothetical protein
MPEQLGTYTSVQLWKLRDHFSNCASTDSNINEQLALMELVGRGDNQAMYYLGIEIAYEGKGVKSDELEIEKNRWMSKQLIANAIKSGYKPTPTASSQTDKTGGN